MAEVNASVLMIASALAGGTLGGKFSVSAGVISIGRSGCRKRRSNMGGGDAGALDKGHCHRGLVWLSKGGSGRLRRNTATKFDAELLRLREGGSGLQRKIGDGLQRKIGDGYWRSGRILGCEAHTVVAPQVKCAQDGL